jgi:hypothetical protein
MPAYTVNCRGGMQPFNQPHATLKPSPNKRVPQHPQKMARPEGFEPPTTKFVAWYSIQLSYGRALTLPSLLLRRIPCAASSLRCRRDERRNYSYRRCVRQQVSRIFFFAKLVCTASPTTKRVRVVAQNPCIHDTSAQKPRGAFDAANKSNLTWKIIHKENNHAPGMRVRSEHTRQSRITREAHSSDRGRSSRSFRVELDRRQLCGAATLSRARCKDDPDVARHTRCRS